MFKSKSNKLNNDIALGNGKYVSPAMTLNYIPANCTDLTIKSKEAGLLVPGDIVLYKLGYPDNDSTRKEISIEGFMDNIPLTFDFGQFLGILIGDGWWDHRSYAGHINKRRLYIADLSNYNAEFVYNYLSNTLKVTNLHHYTKEQLKEIDPNRFGDTIKHTFEFDKTVELCNWLSFNFGGDRSENSSGAANKYIASHFFGDGSPMEFKLGLLNGLIATDGSICINKALETDRLMINFTTTSKELAENVVQLFEEIGVKANMLFSKKTVRGNDSWGVFPSTVDVKLKDAFSKISHLKKREAFLNTDVDIESANARKYEDIPCPKFINEQLKYLFPAYKDKESYTYNKEMSDSKYMRYEIVKVETKNNGCLSHYKAKRIIPVLSALDNMRLKQFEDGKKLIEKWIKALAENSKHEANVFPDVTKEDRKTIYEMVNAIWPMEYADLLKENKREEFMRVLSRTFYKIFTKNKQKNKLTPYLVGVVRDLLNVCNPFLIQLHISPSIQQWMFKFVYVDPTTAYRATAVKEICQ